jgi:hypothetical protein
MQAAGLAISIGAMVYNFLDKGKKPPPPIAAKDDALKPEVELKPLLAGEGDDSDSEDELNAASASGSGVAPVAAAPPPLVAV